MKLYYTSGACSLAPHIVLSEIGVDFDAVAVDLQAKTLPDGSDYKAVNPKGAVPALGLDDGQVLTENATILQYLADHASPTTLLPAAGLERYRVLEGVTYLSTEIHKGFGPLWNPAASDDVKEATRTALGVKFDYLQAQLVGDGFLTGAVFTIADAYLFTLLNWTPMHEIDLARWPGLAAYQQRVMARPMVQKALASEGLI
jgi:glutathione S-transferase